jgi:hypothetical protein
LHSQLASGGSEYTRNRNASKQGAAGILMDSPGPLAGGARPSTAPARLRDRSAPQARAGAAWKF